MVDMTTATNYFLKNTNDVIYKIELLKDLNMLVFHCVYKGWSGTLDDSSNETTFPCVNLTTGKIGEIDGDEIWFGEHDTVYLDLRNLLSGDNLKESLEMLKKVEKLNRNLEQL